MARLRMTAAGEEAGAWGKFGGMGAQAPNRKFIMELALRTNPKTASKFLTEQNRELQRISRGRQDIKLIESQFRRPDQLLTSRVLEDKQEEYKARAEKGRKGPPNIRHKDQSKEGVYGSNIRRFTGRDSERSRGHESGRKKRQCEGSDGAKENRRRPIHHKKVER